MRIRTIKPEFFTHERLYDAEKAESLPLRLSFIGLWCAADREGRFRWEPRRLGVQILPYDQVDFSRVLDALTTRGFVVRYASETGEFGFIPSFPKHQVINNRERDSELPDPNDCKEFDASATREPRVDHAGKAEGKGREGKGKERIPPTPKGDERMESFPLIALTESDMLPGYANKLSRTEKNQTKVKGNTPTMERINEWFDRKPSTLWTVSELLALIRINPSQPELDGMEAFYTAPDDTENPIYRKQSLMTLLNNWPSELDKARGYARRQRGAA